jgi:hypothetical protein
VQVLHSNAYLLSAIPFLLQGMLIFACPQVYKQYRMPIVLALRCFRISMMFRATAMPRTVSITGVKDCYKVRCGQARERAPGPGPALLAGPPPGRARVTRCRAGHSPSPPAAHAPPTPRPLPAQVLLIFSGALPHALLAISYNMPLQLHVALQLVACVLAHAKLQPVCCSIIQEHAVAAAAAADGSSGSGMAVCADVRWFGLPGAALGGAQCRQLFAIVMAYVGFLLPTYVVYVLDVTLRCMFVARLPQGRGRAASIGTSVAKHASILLLASLLCHKLISAILAGPRAGGWPDAAGGAPA